MYSDSKPTLRFTRADDCFKVPCRAYPGDAGYDLFLTKTATLRPGLHRLSTGVSVAFPAGYYGRLTGRSSTLLRHGGLVVEGILDNGYRGELFVNFWALEPTKVVRGDRLAQLLVHRLESVNWHEVDSLKDSERGVQGFGSSGK